MLAARPSHLSLATCLIVLSACPGSQGGESSASDATSSTSAATTGTGTGTTGATTGAPTTGSATAGTTASATSSTTGDTTGVEYGEPFSITILDNAWITGTDGWNSQHKDVAFDLGPATFARVTLVVDLDTDCYPWEKWQQNPPPAGQNWPASCDAFDRTMGFVADPAAGPDDPPGFELLRSITPFGGPAHIEADITDYANTHPGMHVLRSYISSWPDGSGKVTGSAGGWHLSVRIDVEPGPPPRDILAAVSVFSGDVGASGATMKLPFTLPEGTVKAELEYRITGHGGASDPKCIGPAEEFCKRTHHITVDDTLVSSFDAWRTDCVDYCTITDNPLPVGPKKYCLENPCGAIQSVQAPRANWCPGALVEPLRGPITTALGPGPDHTLQFAIDDVVEGGVWTVSAVVYAYGA
ncbi:MAG TPA: peptide-N-glycosidase F-related protein [Nannocystis sp.]